MNHPVYYMGKRKAAKFAVCLGLALSELPARIRLIGACFAAI
jgi:hypothetical protein